MKKLFAVLGVAALLAAGAGSALAQSAESDSDEHDVTITVDEVAMIAVVGGDPSFTVTAPATPGAIFVVTPTDEDSAWLQYTSIVYASGETREITAELTGTTPLTLPPGGSVLSVSADVDPNNNGCGDLGTGESDVDLEVGNANVVVNNVGSCYTGTDVGNDGTRLTYELDVECGAAGFFAGTYNVEVTYTLKESE